MIGGTDIAMRDGLPPGVLAFTVTLPLFAQLCALGDESFLGKGFLGRLRKARGGSLGLSDGYRASALRRPGPGTRSAAPPASGTIRA